MKSTIRILIALVCVLAALCIGMAAAEQVSAETPTPTPAPTATVTPEITPAAEELGKLNFVITGPDDFTTTIPYSEFQEGKYTLEGLIPGEYTIAEQDADKLLQEYTLNADLSTTEVSIEVRPDGTVTDTLKNVYGRTVEVTPTPTPAPSESPSPTVTPTETPAVTPNLEEKISIPVAKIWEDNNNRDRNRPDRVIVYLLADGKRVGQAALSAAGGWKYEFADVPRYHSNGQEISYSVEEESIGLYTASTDGYTIINIYAPETTSMTVSKVWMDQDNAAGLRPASVRCTLNNGMSVELNAGNGWTATVDRLPTVVNGQPAQYYWREQEVIGYTLSSVDQMGSMTVFTNSIFERGEETPDGKNPPPRRRGNNYLIIEDYGTPLGVEVIINHVGDCFD